MIRRTFFICAAASLTLAACDYVPKPKLPERRPDSIKITITAEDGANGGAATPVEFVFASQEVADALESMSAQDWFVQRARLIDSFDDDTQVRTYVVDAGTGTSAAFAKERKEDYAAVFVFARYNAPGDHKYRLPFEDRYAVQLGADAFTAEAVQ